MFSETENGLSLCTDKTENQRGMVVELKNEVDGLRKQLESMKGNMKRNNTVLG